MNLSKDTPEVENWIVDFLNEDEKILFSLEGYSVKDNKVTAIFERRRCDEEVDQINVSDIQTELKKEDPKEWEVKYLFAKRLGVPFYLPIWKEGIDKYLILEIVDENFGLREVDLFTDGRSFAEWLKLLKSIHVSKGFVENGRLSSIDITLRKCGVPWAGNLDAFICIDSDVKSIIEFSRTRKTPVKKHDIRKYFNQDFNRWKPFEILRKQLGVSAYIVLWSSTELHVLKIQKIKEITNNLYFEKEDLIKKEELKEFFK